MKYIFITLLLLAVFCIPATSSETPHLNAYFTSSEESFSNEDVDDIYLKYSSEQDVYIVYITFSKSGIKKFNQLINDKKGKELTLAYHKTILVGPIPMMMESIENPFTVVIKNKDIALLVLKGLSK